MVLRPLTLPHAELEARFQGERPRLRIIQDPISNLDPDLPATQDDACLRATNEQAAQAGMLYRQIQYLVEEGDWAQQAEEVEAPSKTEERGI